MAFKDWSRVMKCSSMDCPLRTNCGRRIRPEHLRYEESFNYGSVATRKSFVIIECQFQLKIIEK